MKKLEKKKPIIPNENETLLNFGGNVSYSGRIRIED